MDDKNLMQQLAARLPASLVPKVLAWPELLVAVQKLNDQHKELAEKAANLFYGMHGCGDHSCFIKPPTGGMGTNGGCRCSKKTSTANIIIARANVLVKEAKKQVEL